MRRAVAVLTVASMVALLMTTVTTVAAAGPQHRTPPAPDDACNPITTRPDFTGGVPSPREVLG